MTKLDRFFNQDVSANIVVTNEGDRETVEVSIHDQSMVFRSEKTTNDRYDSLDQVVDMLFKQIVKHRGKLTRRMRDNAFDDITDDQDSLEDYKIIKKKSINVRPMDIEEAVMRMNLVGHEFFMFLNSETDEMNVVYRRKDGGYGLLEATGN